MAGGRITRRTGRAVGKVTRSKLRAVSVLGFADGSYQSAKAAFWEIPSYIKLCFW